MVAQSKSQAEKFATWSKLVRKKRLSVPKIAGKNGYPSQTLSEKKLTVSWPKQYQKKSVTTMFFVKCIVLGKGNPFFHDKLWLG